MSSSTLLEDGLPLHRVPLRRITRAGLWEEAHRFLDEHVRRQYRLWRQIDGSAPASRRPCVRASVVGRLLG